MFFVQGPGGGDFFMDPLIIIAALSVLLLLFLVVGASLKPFKILGQGIIKILIGALFLFFLNAFGNQFGIHIPINLITASVSGLLGIPGLCALVVIETWII